MPRMSSKLHCRASMFNSFLWGHASDPAPPFVTAASLRLGRHLLQILLIMRTLIIVQAFTIKSQHTSTISLSHQYNPQNVSSSFSFFFLISLSTTSSVTEPLQLQVYKLHFQLDVWLDLSSLGPSLIFMAGDFACYFVQCLQ